jgi:hypothetical protein
MSTRWRPTTADRAPRVLCNAVRCKRRPVSHRLARATVPDGVPTPAVTAAGDVADEHLAGPSGWTVQTACLRLGHPLPAAHYQIADRHWSIANWSTGRHYLKCLPTTRSNFAIRVHSACHKAFFSHFTGSLMADLVLQKPGSTRRAVIICRRRRSNGGYAGRPGGCDMKSVVGRFGISAAAAIAAAHFVVWVPGTAFASPLCPDSMAAASPSIYQKCLQAEQNQATCGLASGCGAPVNEQAPALQGGDDNGGRCDWAKQVGWSQYSQCTVHYGPQTQKEYDQQQDNARCHARYGSDPDHFMCPDLSLGSG